MSTAPLQVTWKVSVDMTTMAQLQLRSHLTVIGWLSCFGRTVPSIYRPKIPRDRIYNGVINPYHTPISTTIITVPVGLTITPEWYYTPHGANSADSSDPIDSSHRPVMSCL